MKFSDLIQYKFHSSVISERDLFVKLTDNEFQQAGKPVGLPDKVSQYKDRILNLPTPGSGEGLWIPYKAKCNVYDYLKGGQSWAASGPFSGCYFYVGKHKGNVYVAHVSCEGPKDKNVEAWNSSDLVKNVLFKKKIGMAKNLPKSTTNAAAVVFADIKGDGVEVTRVDIKTTSPGSMSGVVFDVTKLDSD